MKNTILIFPIILAFLMSACDTNDIASRKLNLTERSNICSQDRFEYDGDQLVGFTQSFGSRVNTVGKCFYKDDQLVRIENTDDGGVSQTIDLEYNEQGLLQKEVITVDVVSPEYKNHYVETSFFEYDEDGHLRLRLQTRSHDSAIFKTEYEWSMGNIVKLTNGFVDQQSDFLPMKVNLLTYDGGRNYTNHDLAFAYTIFLPMEAIVSKNNLVSISEDSFSDDKEIEIQSTNNFKYNTLGYPVENDIKSIFVIGPLVDKLTYE